MSASLLGFAASTKFEKPDTILSYVVLVLLSAEKTERIKLGSLIVDHQTFINDDIIELTYRISLLGPSRSQLSSVSSAHRLNS